MSEDEIKSKSFRRHFMATNATPYGLLPLSPIQPQLSSELRSQRDLIKSNTHFAPAPWTAATELWNSYGEKPRNSYRLPKPPGRRGPAGRADLLTFSSAGPGNDAPKSGFLRTLPSPHGSLRGPSQQPPRVPFQTLPPKCV